MALGGVSLAAAGFMAETNTLQQPLYAGAGIDACPKLAMSGASLLAVMKPPDPEGQVSVARQNNMVEYQREQSIALFEMLGSGACEAALNFESKPVSTSSRIIGMAVPLP
jgi:hypothetical protein